MSKSFQMLLGAAAILASITLAAYSGRSTEQNVKDADEYSYRDTTKAAIASTSHANPSIISPSGRVYHNGDVVDLNDFLGTPGDETDWNYTEIEDFQWDYLQSNYIVIDTSKCVWVIKIP